MSLTDVIPWYWKAGAAAVLALAIAAGVKLYGAHEWQQGHDAAVSARATQDAVAVITRAQDNAALSIAQDAINVTITKARNEELAPVVARIAADRVRVGPALCGGSPAAPEAQSTAGGDSADPPGRLVRPDLDRDIRALKLAVEEDLATGRACQAFLDKNGLVP